MAYLTKDKNKAKYLVRSTEPNGTKMQEFCDNLKQVKHYMTEAGFKGRKNVQLWTRTPYKPSHH